MNIKLIDKITGKEAIFRNVSIASPEHSTKNFYIVENGKMYLCSKNEYSWEELKEEN